MRREEEESAVVTVDDDDARRAVIEAVYRAGRRRMEDKLPGLERLSPE